MWGWREVWLKCTCRLFTMINAVISFAGVQQGAVNSQPVPRLWVWMGGGIDSNQFARNLSTQYKRFALLEKRGGGETDRQNMNRDVVTASIQWNEQCCCHFVSARLCSLTLGTALSWWSVCLSLFLFVPVSHFCLCLTLDKPLSLSPISLDHSLSLCTFTDLFVSVCLLLCLRRFPVFVSLLISMSMFPSLCLSPCLTLCLCFFFLLGSLLVCLHVSTTGR